MLDVALLLALAAAPPTGATRLTALPMLSNDPALAELGRAVAGAAYAAAQQRGMVAVDVASVQPIAEAIAACGSVEPCRVAAARRLGVRFVLVPAQQGAGALVRLVDLEGGAVRARVLTGDRRAALAAVPAVVDALLEAAAPRAAWLRTQALERAGLARGAKDLDAEELALSDAIAAGALDDEAAELMLMRARVLERRGDELAADAAWEALVAVLATAPSSAPDTAPSTAPTEPDHQQPSAATRARLLDTAHAHLLARAGALTTTDALGAARRYARAGELFGDLESRFLAAELFRAGGAPDLATMQLQRIVDDESSPADVRLRALTALHGA